MQAFAQGIAEAQFITEHVHGSEKIDAGVDEQHRLAYIARAQGTQRGSMNIMTKISYLIALLLIFVSSTALADTRLVYQGAGGEFVVSMRPGEVRIDDTGSAWQLYRQETNTIYAVTPDDKSYTRMDEGVAATIHAQMAALREKIETQIQQLPPSQQDVARAVLSEQIPGLDDAQHSVALDRTGRNERVAGVPCQIVQVVRDGDPGETLCVATPGALGISDASFESVKAMFGLMRTMLAGTGFEAVGLPFMSLSGMPIRFHDPVSDAQRTLVDVSHEPLDDALFDLPDTYIEQAPPTPDTSGS